MSGEEAIGEVRGEDPHRRFMRKAREVAADSKDPRQKVGAVVVDSLRRRVADGYNGFPRGVADTHERLHDGRLKNLMTVHAELNALLNSPVDPRGCALYSTRFPCHECAKAIIQRGIHLVVAPRPDHIGESKWSDSWRLSYSLLQEAGVTVIYEDNLP